MVVQFDVGVCRVPTPTVEYNYPPMTDIYLFFGEVVDVGIDVMRRDDMKMCFQNRISTAYKADEKAIHDMSATGSASVNSR